jgi:polygalacturonase
MVPLEFKELRNLTKFNCNFCCLSGTFPDVFKDKPFLEEIFWDGNNFTGTIPASVGSLSALTKVSFNLNSFRGGAVPEGLSELPLLHDCRIGADTDFAPYEADYPWLIQPVAGNTFACPIPSSIADGVCNSSDADPVPSPVFCDDSTIITTTTTTTTTTSTGASPHSLLRSLTGRENVFDVTAFGARGDGVTMDTAAIVAAVAAVTAAGEGVVLLPCGRSFLSAPFNLTSHCTLYIEEGASLVGSSDKADYPVIAALPSYGEGKKGGPGRRMSLVHGQGLEDVVVTGANGTIDGSGAAWWFNKTSGDTPPHLVELMFSAHVELSNLTLVNSPFWTVHPYVVDYFLARHLWIFNPTSVSNTDGIDPDSTRHALIHDVYIVTGDDGIAIKSGCKR